MDKKLIKEALELCLTAIKAIHPHISSDEPCIAFEAHEAAHHALSTLKRENPPHIDCFYFGGCGCNNIRLDVQPGGCQRGAKA